MDNKEFLRTQYLKILKREPDQEGFYYYLSKLDRKELKRKDITHLLKISEEYHLLAKTPDKYLYQEKDDKIIFEEGVNFLRGVLKNDIYVEWANHFDPHVVLKVFESLNEVGVARDKIKVHKEEYEKYLKQANYKRKYPDYYKGNLYEKSFEHFLCYKFLELKRGDNFVDIASEHSPIPEIFQRLTGCNSYAQDIMYERGIHGNRIGGDASRIPVPDHFFKAAIATCSIEHFENDSDIQFMKEMERILMRGGKVIIVPLYMFMKPAIQTDPKCSLPGNVTFDEDADIYCAKDWGNRHGRLYSAGTLHKRLIEPNRNMEFKVCLLENPQDIHPSVYCRFILIGTKK